jgi:Tol biopolymer transport system component
VITGGDNDSGVPAIDAEGGVVAYESTSTDLVPGQVSTGIRNVFIFDRLAGTTTLVSHAAGSPGTGANGLSSAVQVSADGRYILYRSLASNLIAGQSGTAPATGALYLYDRMAGTTSLVTHASDSATAVATGLIYDDNLGADGRFVVFSSTPSNLVAGQGSSSSNQVYLFDRTTGAVQLVTHAPGSPLTPGDFASGSPSISADGRFVALVSQATNLAAGIPAGSGPYPYRAYLYDRLADSLSLLGSPGADNLHSGAAETIISADGSHVAFQSDVPDLFPGLSGCESTDQLRINLFLYDRASGSLSLASHTPGSPTACGDGISRTAALSADGGFVAFDSSALNLVPGDF